MFSHDLAFDEAYKLFQEKLEKATNDLSYQKKLSLKFLIYVETRIEEKDDPKAKKWFDEAQNNPNFPFHELKKEEKSETQSAFKPDFKNLKFEKTFDDDKEESYGSSIIIDGDDFFEEANEFIDAYVRKKNTPPKQTQLKQNTAIDQLGFDIAYEQLNRMIGLRKAKEKAKVFYDFTKVLYLKRRRNIPSPPLSFHMMLSGKSGSGKTTVARHYGKIFKSLGFLNSGHLVETSRTELVGEYIGQTEQKTKKIFKEALDGVLFIDEAHNLYNHGSYKDFGHQCLSTLIKLMEDHRDRVVVIFAGYKDEMKNSPLRFPGLQSRIQFYIDFDDYTIDDLVDIFDLMAEQNHLTLSDEAAEFMRSEIIKRKKTENVELGGRYIRNLFEKTLLNQMQRIASIDDPTDQEIQTILACDIDLSGHATKGNVTYLK